MFTSAAPDTDSFSLTSYNRYPADRPFINDDYDPTNPVHPSDSFPESNRQAVLSAMKKLQDKIYRLDIEKTAAEANLQSLSVGKEQYQAGVRAGIATRDTDRDVLHRHTHELESQLASAGSRCNTLERRLDDMRQLVRETEAKYQGLTVAPSGSRDVDSRLGKISELEREHHKLSATQTIAQDKLRELEEKLNQERARRSVLETKQTDSTTTPKLVDFDIATLKSARPQKVVKKKRRDQPVTGLHPRAKPHPGQHYRVKLSDIPFVAGKSISPSHSVGANVQRVISLMKSHNHTLCSRASSPPVLPSHGDVTDVLLQLQKEFNQLTKEHDTLLSHMNAADRAGPTDALQSQLEGVIARLETKSDQISKLRKYQNKTGVTKATMRRRPQSAPATPGHTTVMTSTTRKPSEVKVTTTIRTKNSAGLSVVPGPKTGASLNTLKCMKKLQTTLRPNDLSWD